jgi:hypothetical protein
VHDEGKYQNFGRCSEKGIMQSIISVIQPDLCWLYQSSGCCSCLQVEVPGELLGYIVCNTSLIQSNVGGAHVPNAHMTKVSSSPYFKKANELHFNLNKVPWTFYRERCLYQWRLNRNLEAVGPKLLRESLSMDPLVSATHLPKKMVNVLLK